ncbi:hypothetical protein GTW71_00815, partial [Streptomyces sp. SID6041]|nr:hypothetical protein [Streptomyces sp. SID6041]
MRIWDLATGPHHVPVTGHTDSVCAVAITRIDGRPYGLSASGDGTLQVRDLATGAHTATLTGHTGSLTDLAVTDLDGRPHALTTSN